jgi:hypothetical protein
MKKKSSTNRGAGRPKIVKNTAPIKGILSQPNDPNNSIEFVYGFPTSIKYLWQIFKRMNAAKNYITFFPQHIEILSHSHNKKSSIRCNIDCTNVGEYYCEEKTSIVIDCANFVSITKKIDSKFNDFQLYFQKNNNYSIIIKLTPLNGITEQYEISLTDDYDADTSLMRDAPEYPIQIQMGCKYLKRTITEIKKNVKLMAFVQESGTSPVMLQYHTDEDTVFAKYQFQRKSDVDEEKKKEPQSLFISSVPDDSLFRIVFRTEYIKPFGTSMPNDVINIFLHEEYPIKMTLESHDNAISISIFISIEFTD